MHFAISLAGFFATHNNLFFDISFLYACLPPLKNDGREDVFFNGITFLPVIYSMPDSSLLITICFLIFHFFMYAYHRSRMTAREDCVFQWYYILARHLFYAGFFAKSQIMFFLLSPFLFCPPLKNDGRGDVVFYGITFLSVILERT